MGLELLGFTELPENLKPGGFDHAAVHCGLGRLYVAHTANDTLDVNEPGAHTIGFDAERNKIFAFLPKTHRAAAFFDRG